MTHGYRRGSPQPLGAHAADEEENDAAPLKPTALAAVASFLTCCPPQSGQTGVTGTLIERTKTSNRLLQSSQ